MRIRELLWGMKSFSKFINSVRLEPRVVIILPSESDSTVLWSAPISVPGADN